MTTPEDYKTKKVADIFTPQAPDEGASMCLGKHTKLQQDLQILHEEIADLQWTVHKSLKRKGAENLYFLSEIVRSLEDALADIEEINWRSGGDTAMFHARCDYCRYPKGWVAESTGERYSASPTGLVCSCN